MRTVIDEMRSVFRREAENEAELRSLEERLASAQDADTRERLLREYTQRQQQQESSGVYDIDRRIESVLSSLGLPESAWEKPIEGFSGGERNVIGLARVLLSDARPDAARRALQPPRHGGGRVVHRVPPAIEGGGADGQPQPPPARCDRADDLGAGAAGHHRLDRELRGLPAPEGGGARPPGAPVQDPAAADRAHRVPGAAADGHGQRLRRPGPGEAGEGDAQAHRTDGHGRAPDDRRPRASGRPSRARGGTAASP